MKKNIANSDCRIEVDKILRNCVFFCDNFRKKFSDRSNIECKHIRHDANFMYEQLLTRNSVWFLLWFFLFRSLLFYFFSYWFFIHFFSIIIIWILFDCCDKNWILFFKHTYIVIMSLKMENRISKYHNEFDWGDCCGSIPSWSLASQMNLPNDFPKKLFPRRIFSREFHANFRENSMKIWLFVGKNVRNHPAFLRNQIIVLQKTLETILFYFYFVFFSFILYSLFFFCFILTLLISKAIWHLCLCVYFVHFLRTNSKRKIVNQKTKYDFYQVDFFLTLCVCGVHVLF